MINEEARDACLICVDAGTTNTRVWLTAGDRAIASARAGVGVRDTARDGSSKRLREALRELIDRVCNESRDQGFGQSAGRRRSTRRGCWSCPRRCKSGKPLGLLHSSFRGASRRLGEIRRALA